MLVFGVGADLIVVVLRDHVDREFMARLQLLVGLPALHYHVLAVNYSDIVVQGIVKSGYLICYRLPFLSVLKIPIKL